MSPCTKVNLSIHAKSGNGGGLISKPTTSYPASVMASDSANPTKPDDPVTSTLMIAPDHHKSVEALSSPPEPRRRHGRQPSGPNGHWLLPRLALHGSPQRGPRRGGRASALPPS